jgi:hypothetical protein
VKQNQAARPQQKPAPYWKEHVRKDHPLVKRAAESEVEPPKKKTDK